MLMEAGMLFIIDGGTFYFFTKNMWIRDSGELCHIMNDDTSLFDIININELIQGSSRNMPARKKGSFASMSDKLMTPNGPYSKACLKASANLFSLTCELSQGNVTTRITSWINLQMGISSLIAELRLMMVE